MMNEEGFPKNPIFKTVEIRVDCINRDPHDFSNTGHIHKIDTTTADNGTEKKERVVLQVFYCSQCLTFAYIEVLRTPLNEMFEAGIVEQDHVGQVQ